MQRIKKYIQNKAKFCPTPYWAVFSNYSSSYIDAIVKVIDNDNDFGDSIESQALSFTKEALVGVISKAYDKLPKSVKVAIANDYTFKSSDSPKEEFIGAMIRQNGSQETTVRDYCEVTHITLGAYPQGKKEVIKEVKSILNGKISQDDWNYLGLLVEQMSGKLDKRDHETLKLVGSWLCLNNNLKPCK